MIILICNYNTQGVFYLYLFADSALTNVPLREIERPTLTERRLWLSVIPGLYWYLYAIAKHTNLYSILCIFLFSVLSCLNAHNTTLKDIESCSKDGI